MKGLTSNKLKIIAAVLMVADHIGYYFVSYISDNTFDILRFFGRMAMPIFAFLLVQGFLHTKNLGKYIMKLFSVATIFQACLVALGIVNNVYVKNYYIVINTYLNILYSFVICLLMLSVITKKNMVRNKIVNYIIRSILFIVLLSLYFVIEIELGLRVPCIVLGVYLAEILQTKKKIQTEGYMLIVFLTLVLSVFADYKHLIFNLPSIISILLISLYNGERGNNNKFLKNIFYIFYPLHHIILYISVLVITYKVR